MAEISATQSVRYEPQEAPTPLVALGAGLQASAVIAAPIVLTVIIVARIGKQPESYITWAVFAALLVSGITTALQAAKVGRIGSGHILLMGTSGAFIAVCVGALILGGPSTMASLIVVSSLFQFLMASRLAALRRVFTPVVSGTVIMLIGAIATPIVFDSLTDVPSGVNSMAAPISALVTLIVVVAIMLRAPAAWRLWSPVIGIGIGSLVSLPFGLYDFDVVRNAAWFGVDFGGWPGFDFTPGREFWILLPAFIVVTLVGAIETIGDGVAIQRVSYRKQRATDFRVVQGALNADGVGNLLSGIAGTLPNTTYSSSISLAEVTGVASRRVGVVIGGIFVALAFLPKLTALLTAIPLPVAAAYLLVLLGLLFVQGMKIVIQDGVDHRRAVMVGVAFWLGVGFENKWIFADLLGDGLLGILLGNGMSAGAIIAIIMMAIIELTRRRHKKLQVVLDWDALPKLGEFLRGVGTEAGWSGPDSERLVLVGEETLSNLLSDESAPDGERHLIVRARSGQASAELEFVCASDRENLEDKLAYMGEAPDLQDTRAISHRLLRHYASSVRHSKYHDVDIITLTVERSG